MIQLLKVTPFNYNGFYVGERDKAFDVFRYENFGANDIDDIAHPHIEKSPIFSGRLIDRRKWNSFMAFMRVKAFSIARNAKVVTGKSSCDNIDIVRENSRSFPSLFYQIDDAGQPSRFLGCNSPCPPADPQLD